MAEWLALVGQHPLTTIYQTLWHDLHGAIAPSSSPFGLLQLATLGENAQPKLRTVVLRGIDIAQGQVTFYSDARAAKVTDLLAHSRVSLLFYDATKKIQIRCQGEALLITGDARQQAWQQCSDHGKFNYQQNNAPATPITTPEQAIIETSVDDQWFAMINVKLDHLDYLSLAASPHQRAEFRRVTEDYWQDHWQGRWLTL